MTVYRIEILIILGLFVFLPLFLFARKRRAANKEEPEWINEELVQDGSIEIQVRQHKYKPLKNVFNLTVAVVFGVLFFIGVGMVTDPVVGLFSVLIGVIGGLGAVLGWLGAIGAAIGRPASSYVRIESDRVLIDSKGKQKVLKRSGISNLYTRNPMGETDEVTYDRSGNIMALPGQAAASVGDNIGKTTLSVFKDCSSVVACNYIGKEVVLMNYLSDDEAHYLLARLSQHLR